MDSHHHAFFLRHRHQGFLVDQPLPLLPWFEHKRETRHSRPFREAQADVWSMALDEGKPVILVDQRSKAEQRRSPIPIVRDSDSDVGDWVDLAVPDQAKPCLNDNSKAWPGHPPLHDIPHENDRGDDGCIDGCGDGCELDVCHGSTVALRIAV